MSRHLKDFFIICCLCLFAFSSEAVTGGPTGLNMYAAAGPNFIFPTSARIGWDRWELGLLTRGFLGINKTFPVMGRSTYSSFGTGINVDGFSTNLGFQVAVGWNYNFLWKVGLRTEMLANANLNGNMMAHALIGASYGF